MLSRQEACPDGEVNDRSLLCRDVAAEVAHEVCFPGGELLRQRGTAVEQPAADRLDGAPQRREPCLWYGRTRGRCAPDRPAFGC